MKFKQRLIKFVRLPALMPAPRALPPAVDYSRYESPTYLRRKKCTTTKG